MSKRILVSIFIFITLVISTWAVVRYKRVPRQIPATELPHLANNDAADWNLAVEQVKADRGPEGAGAIEVPTELKHYPERHWFLATQVAEIAKYQIHTCQDYVDLAAAIERGEMVEVPWVTDTYVLFGVAAKADDSVFARYEDDHELGLYSEAELTEAYRQLDLTSTNLHNEIASLKSQASKLTKRDRARQRDIQKQIAEREQGIKDGEEERALLDQFYKQPESRARLTREYQSLQTLASNFRGRSYNIDLPADRAALKVSLLSSLRPEALKILEEVASIYHRQFKRPLPISSLVRPEQYQHALHRVNRNAVLIDAPPHSTGLAFDIDYRYMSPAEQTFLMAQLAQIKREGRIEVIRERNANYHVFAFVKGMRPSDELIAQYLEAAGAEPAEANHPPSSEKPKVKTSTKKTRQASTVHKKRRRH
ncbi:MAG TPA: DUF5715 family protein [Pyrinomonadaceae bacterium]|jgi:hypothetical protein|nr:DUF5715 family protein [Pyrinomonadaceae bacterium]